MWNKIVENLKAIWREPMLLVAGAVWVSTLVVEKWDQILVYMTMLGIPVAYQEALLKVASVILALTAWWIGRGYTTPLSDPRDINGVPLVPYYKRDV